MPGELFKCPVHSVSFGLRQGFQPGRMLDHLGAFKNTCGEGLLWWHSG